MSGTFCWLKGGLCSVPGVEHDRNQVWGASLTLGRDQGIVEAESITPLHEIRCIFPFTHAIYMLLAHSSESHAFAWG